MKKRNLKLIGQSTASFCRQCRHFYRRSVFLIRCDSSLKKMRHISFFCLFMLVIWLGHDGALSQSSTYGERGSDLGIQAFQKVVSSKPLENVVVSPHGVASILGMLLPGAHGETRKQVLSALRYKKNGKGRRACTRASLCRAEFEMSNGCCLHPHRAVQDVEEAAQDLDGQVQPGRCADCQRHVH